MDIKSYRNWLKENDFLYTRFNLLSDKLTNFLLNKRLVNKEFTQDVASKFKVVLESCDEIDYREESTATAYAILHFLPRFYRFQLIFSKLIDKQIFPLSKKPINVLDIGTGPGPSLFALSDIYLSLKLYCEERKEAYLTSQEYTPDYVERSDGFRNWLHHFTEFANYPLPKNTIGWKVPYHHGTFHDFNNIQFNEEYGYIDYNDDGEDMWLTKKVKYRFNIIVLSNFLTKFPHVTNLKNELQNCMRFLRHNGKLIISGGSGKANSEKDYPEIYKKAKEILLENVYGNHKLFAKAKYIQFNKNKLFISNSDRFGNRIKEFNRTIFSRLVEHKAIDKIGLKTKEKIVNSFDEKYKREYKCEFHIFEKMAKPKRTFRFKKKVI